VKRQDAARPQAIEEGDDRCRPPAKRAQRHAVARLHRRRTRDALPGEMLHQRDEERQVLRLHPFLVERQDEGAALGAQEEIRILHALCDALAGDDLADVVVADEGGEILVADVGIDRHGVLTRAPRIGCGVSWSARSIPAQCSCGASDSQGPTLVRLDALA